MIKKSTLIVFLCAVILGGSVYFFEWRNGKKPPAPEDTSKPAFTFQADDVTSINISHPNKPDQPPIRLDFRNGMWSIMQPLDTGADQSAARGIVDSLSSARIAQSEPGTPDRLNAYGLEPAHVSLEFQLKNGTKHTVLMGDKDFSATNVYSVIDGGKTVSLLPFSLETAADKSVADLRDRSVLHIESGKIASFDLKNSSGELAADKQSAKDQVTWKFTKPDAGSMADSDGVNSLLSTIGNAKSTAISSEQPENLAKYGLSSPAITFSAATDSGQKFSLLVGKKEGDGYFARDSSRPIIFVINADLYKKLGQTFADLRDKSLVHVTEADINHIEIQNANATMGLSRKQGTEFDWTIDSPADVKGKTGASWRILSPLTSAHADEVLDHPPAGVAAKLAKPAIQVELTDKNGSKLTVKISAPVGDFVYAQTTAGSAIYKFKKTAFDDLNFKPSDLAS
jgi:hypothetical protein